MGLHYSLSIIILSTSLSGDPQSSTVLRDDETSDTKIEVIETESSQDMRKTVRWIMRQGPSPVVYRGDNEVQPLVTDVKSLPVTNPFISLHLSIPNPRSEE